MDPQERLMFQGALGVLATVITVLFGYQVKDHRECKSDRLALRRMFEKTLEERGIINGQLEFIKGQMAIYKSVFRKLKISLPEVAAEEGEAGE